ncbi:hypothetical protein BSZ35_15885 [Salinibacter sp. 10B]|nr:hypothetical protein BSZ35_15885 [Salinibacter sp. 10B]
MINAMDNTRKGQLFHLTFWGAALLYVWVIAMLWLGPEWGMSGRTYFFVAILPAVVGVVSMAAAVGLYMDLYQDDS